MGGSVVLGATVVVDPGPATTVGGGGSCLIVSPEVKSNVIACRIASTSLRSATCSPRVSSSPTTSTNARSKLATTVPSSRLSPALVTTRTIEGS